MTKAKRDQSSERSMSELTFDVKNFGPIAKGRVELRPLTVFAGPSNTGKSWLATLIYVIEKTMGENFAFGVVHNIFSEQSTRNRLTDEELKGEPPLFPENVDRWRDEILAKGEVHLTATEIETIRESVERLEYHIEMEFRRFFGVDKTSDLINQNHRGKAYISASLGRIAHRMNINRQSDESLSLNVDMPKKVVLYPVINEIPYLSVLLGEINEIKIAQSREESRNFSNTGTGLFMEMTDMIMTSLFMCPSNGVAYYLPADRGGIMHTHSLVIGETIRNASLIGSRRGMSSPVLSGVIGDFLRGLHRIAESSSRGKNGHLIQKNMDYLVEIFEKEILRGKVEMEIGEVDYPRFFYRPQDWTRLLPLMSVSSMVSELAPVALYLKYLVKPYDLLIIEEPEAHLHPALQAHFTKAIALLVRAGIRVLITTHSEWVLEELANIVARGEMKRSKNKHKQGFNEIGLQEEEVGVWLFDFIDKNNMKKGSKIEKVSWDLDEGGYITGYDEVAMALHNDWADLVSRSS